MFSLYNKVAFFSMSYPLQLIATLLGVTIRDDVYNAVAMILLGNGIFKKFGNLDN